MKLQRGDQVIYVPSHADTDVNHPDAETGFVTSVTEDGRHAFVRYWRRGSEGFALRARANSERTPIQRLWPMSKRDPRYCRDNWIQKELQAIAREELLES